MNDKTLMLGDLLRKKLAEVRDEPPHIPVETKASLERYIIERIKTGGFLRAVLENNLKEAVARADNTNRRALTDIVQWIYNYAPVECWGSQARVNKWLEDGNPKPTTGYFLFEKVPGDETRSPILRAVAYGNIDSGKRKIIGIAEIEHTFTRTNAVTLLEWLMEKHKLTESVLIDSAFQKIDNECLSISEDVESMFGAFPDNHPLAGSV